jgi:hypothetical protein
MPQVSLHNQGRTDLRPATPNEPMSTNVACTIDNVSPERMGLYFSRSDVEAYLRELWPKVALSEFKISVRCSLG